MATSSGALSDKNSTGTDLLKTVIHSKRLFHECFTLQLIGCNPIGGDSFTEASITTQVKLSTFQCPENICEKSYKTLFFDLEDVFDIDKLEKLINAKEICESDKESGPERQKQKTVENIELEALQILDQYCSKFDYHQRCLMKVLDSPERPLESDVVKVLNVHLFQPLSGGKCFIDSHILKEDNHLCSCGCEEKVEQGHTGIGLEPTWHGYADMLVKRTIPVAVLDEVEKSSLDSSVELKKENETLQTNKSGFSHLIAQTITNAFAQSNRNSSLSDIPIPAFGCTPSEIFIYAYDCKNDVLLQKCPFANGMSITVTSAPVMLWLYINFSLFMRKNVTDLTLHPELCEFRSHFKTNEYVCSFYQSVKCEVAEFKYNTREINLLSTHLSHGKKKL